MTRAAAIIVIEGAVALIERVRPQDTYFLFPGGTVEEGETDAEAVRREVREELGLEVEVGSLIAEVSFEGRVQRYYAAKPCGGDFGSGQGPELTEPADDDGFRPVLVDLSELLDRNVHPRAVAEIVAASAREGWPAATVFLVDAGRPLRQPPEAA